MIAEEIEKAIQTTLSPKHFSLEDQSAAHAGHAGQRESGGGHYAVTVVSEEFSGKSRIERHRAVYAAVDTLISSGKIHAISIQAFAPDEWKGDI